MTRGPMRVSGERPNPPVDRCRRCGLDVIVAHTQWGAAMQVDPTPALPGTGDLLLYFEVDYTGQPVDGRQRVTNLRPAVAESAELAGIQPATMRLWLEHRCPPGRGRR